MCTVRICKDGKVFEIVVLIDNIPDLWHLLKDVQYKVFYQGSQAIPKDFGYGLMPNWVERFGHEE